MKTLIQEVNVVNEGSVRCLDVAIHNDKIAVIAPPLSISTEGYDRVVSGKGLHLFPGAIDDQVHFREPGLTHKGELYTEAKAAVAGGITSYMEMPNTVPPATTIELLEQKYTRAAEVSLGNYSFFMGTTNSNLDQLLQVDPKKVCGVKIFMGSSTGEMVVDNPESLRAIFREVKTLIATHCEDDPMIKKLAASYAEQYGEDIPMRLHPIIRSEEACYASSSFAVSLAKEYGTRLHILHISTAKELELFRNDVPLSEKKITAEACIHHLWFSDEDYDTKGSLIKWNPAVKTANDRMNIRQAVRDGRIDVIATDHAPHTIEEKGQKYAKAPSGGPLVQHALVAMLEMVRQGEFTLELVAQKMAHQVAEMFAIENRGFIREGYFADLVLVDLNKPWTVTKENLLYKCGWSPFEGTTFHAQVVHTFVNGHLAYTEGTFDESKRGMRLTFNR
jgi:dihydroorotase